ncbi:Membrane protein involved in the export of O-antigen and teichoic acid [Tangfeifania diversioriginum]|uniref:Membrane protein involved in the export of O-antigen and teichoic acid n=1 Tax=Tangfeifania diversioriginum TaxID=1168035 RepID=A0A1M6BGF2_9BACT|nr:polysaccharide biosynthesis C-terminal domain-containing protein [Tangfeifania diversioriginum]SHI47668.1 Membrane protein involved in the export of O-antigen and teichoic acid [Tangfeifania diversioriginum]
MFLKKYINNISGLQVFQLIRFGTLLLISIVFAKSHLTTESIGNYEFFLFITALFCSFWINGLIQSFLPLYRKNKTFDSSATKSPEIFNAFILISFLSILTILILLIFKAPISGILGSSGSIPYFNLILVYIFFSSPSFLIEYIYLLKNRPGEILRYGIITFTAQFIFVSLPVFLEFDIKTALSGLIIISIIRYVWLIILLKKYTLFAISFNFIKEHIHFAWPLIISTLVGSSASYVDGFLVLNKFDEATFAIFRYGAKEFPLVLLMANALSTAMISEFSQKEKLTGVLVNLRKRSANLMHLLFPVTIFFLVFSHWLYPKIFNPDFAESAVIFNIYLLLIISRLVFPHTILIGMKKTNIIMHASFLELAVNVLLSIIFINLWGIKGVAFATVIAFAFQKIVWLTYNKKVLGISPKNYIPLKSLTIYSLITIVVFCLMY